MGEANASKKLLKKKELEMKKLGLLVIVLVFLALSVSGCKSADEKALELRCVKPVSNEGLIIVVDGYGNQGTYGDAVNGRKIIVRDDQEPNANGWYTREVYQVSDLKDLEIDEKYEVDFEVEYERDFSQAKENFVPYFSMNISPKVSDLTLQEFLNTHQSVIATSVVNREDHDGKMQECSLRGLQPDAVRFVFYSGEGVTYQVCNPEWTRPR